MSQVTFQMNAHGIEEILFDGDKVGHLATAPNNLFAARVLLAGGTMIGNFKSREAAEREAIDFLCPFSVIETQNFTSKAGI